MSAYISIMVEDYETKNKTHIDTKYEREKMVAALV